MTQRDATHTPADKGLDYEGRTGGGLSAWRALHTALALATNAAAVIVLLLVWIMGSQISWGDRGTVFVVVCFVLAMPLFVLNLLVAVISLVNFRRTGRDIVMWCVTAEHACTPCVAD